MKYFKQCIETVPIERLYRAANSLVDSVMRNEITQMLSASNIQRKPDVILNGGIFWAITVFTRPQQYFDREDPAFIQITIEDVVRLKNMVKDNYKEMSINPKIYLNTINSEDMEGALTVIDEIHKIGERRLLCGAIFVEEIMKYNNDSSIPKTYRFAKYGHIGWPAGWIIKKIGLIEDNSKNQNIPQKR